MYNTELPTHAELPSSQQLLRSTLIAAVVAGVLLTTVVLPAEYGIDPTGFGRILRLTEMGEIKNKLAAEVAAEASVSLPTNTTSSLKNAKPSMSNPTIPLAVTPTAGTVGSAVTPVPWRDTISLTLKPGEGTEVKLTMNKDASAQYAWVVEAGEVNYDTHGDSGGRSLSYQKGQGASSDAGVLTAAFTGNHGWYWRNKGTADVKLILRTRGEYSEIKRMM